MINNKELEHIPKTVSSIIDKLKTIDSIYRLILFGSRVHGDFTIKSDFDIAVDLWSKSDFDFLLIKDKVENVYESLYFISLVDYGNSPKKLKNIIDKSGVILYESKKNTK